MRKAKHIYIKHLFGRELLNKNFIQMINTNTQKIIVDMFPKPLDRIPFWKFLSLLGMVDGVSPLQKDFYVSHLTLHHQIASAVKISGRKEPRTSGRCLLFVLYKLRQVFRI